MSIDENDKFKILNEINNNSVELLLEEHTEESLTMLKKAESILENLALSIETKIDKKMLIIILHNIACCYQKLKDYENCVSYLEAAIFHFDGFIKSKHGITIEKEYFSKVNVANIDCSSENLKKNPKLGDMILQMRFSAKFHLQMCAVLSQAKSHKEALDHAELSSLICEDNLSKTYLLFQQIKRTLVKKTDKHSSNNTTNTNANISTSAFEEKLKEIEKIIENIHNKFKSNCANIQSHLKDEEIEHFKNNENLKISVRNILGVKKKDDWINYLNIGNIMYLSALNYDDLDLDSDAKFELLRDAVLEKIVMLTVAYFCVATEYRFIESEESTLRKHNALSKSEHWHAKAVEFACTYLPSCCPLVKHYISTYHKHYSSNLNVIPEDEIINNRVEVVRANVDADQDPVLFVRSVPMERKEINGASLVGNIAHKIPPLKLSNLNLPKKQALSDRTNKKNIINNLTSITPNLTSRTSAKPSQINSPFKPFSLNKNSNINSTDCSLLKKINYFKTLDFTKPKFISTQKINSITLSPLLSSISSITKLSKQSKKNLQYKTKTKI